MQILVETSLKKKQKTKYIHLVMNVVLISCSLITGVANNGFSNEITYHHSFQTQKQ